MTNREWLESLTDKQLAEFFTQGLMANFNTEDLHNVMNFPVTIQQIAGGYMQSTTGIEKWLSTEQTYKAVN